jgi:hypothetical protein
MNLTHVIWAISARQRYGVVERKAVSAMARDTEAGTYQARSLVRHS